MSALDRLYRLTSQVCPRFWPDPEVGREARRTRGGHGFQIHGGPMRPQAERLVDKQRTLQDEASLCNALEEEGAGSGGNSAAAAGC